MTKAKKTLGDSLGTRRRFAPGKRRLTAEQFRALCPHLTNISAERLEAARLAMVEDRPMQAIATHFGWSSRQTVSDAVSSVYAAWTRLEEAQLMSDMVGVLTPAGWESVTLVAPPTLITRWRKELQAEFGKTLAAAHSTQVQAEKRLRPAVSVATSPSKFKRPKRSPERSRGPG